VILVSCEAAFAEDGHAFDLVVNCASETKPGQTDPVYREGIVKVTQNCATQAVQHKIKKYIEISSGHMASSGKVSNYQTGTNLLLEKLFTFDLNIII